MIQVVEIKKPQNTFSIFWHLTDFCNFKCAYCPPFCKSGDFSQGRKPGAPTNEEILEFLDRLDSGLLANGSVVNLVISGGEPTIHPLFGEIVSRVRTHGNVTVNTNGARPLNWWRALPALPTGVNISLHHAETKIDRINELATYLLEQDVQVRFNLMCDPTNWEASIGLYTDLSDDLKRMVMAQVLHDPFASNNREMFVYTDEQKAWIKAQNQKLSNYRLVYGSKYNDENSIVHFSTGQKRKIGEISETNFKLNNWHMFKDWECSAGSTSININFNGEVWSSICKAVKLGRINDFELLKTLHVCKDTICIHPYDMALPKVSPQKSSP